jgi:predicted  nucleic acid-binding Zn-ribbon protein
MHPDLVQLVDLQRIDSAIAACRKGLTDLPAREAALAAKLAVATAARDTARQRAADNKAGRGAVEKDLAIVQSRLARFKDQTMAVKTNKEFHALQHEIAVAQEEIQKFEDRILEFMMDADDLSAAAKAAEGALADAERTVADARAKLAADRARLEIELEQFRAQRDAVAARLPRQALTLYSVAAKQGGLAVTPVHEGHCGVCHVRLRPQVAQSVHANDSLIACESCGRILYFAPPVPSGSGDGA